MSFSQKVHERMENERSRLAIGVDPDPERIYRPDSGFSSLFPGKDPGYVLDAFCDMVLNVALETSCAVKPQAAFFESMGLFGLESLSRCLKKARALGIPTILDAKRGDIGNTAKAYARAYLDPSSPFFVDALTVNPYLGPDTLQPFIEKAASSGSGIFILVKTSNPGSHAFQDLRIEDGETLFLKVAKMVARLADTFPGTTGYSEIGAVIGATYPHDLKVLRSVLPRSIILVPGLGTQGGTPDMARAAFHPGGKGAIVVAARSVIFAYESFNEKEVGPLTLDSVRKAVFDAAIKVRDDIEKAIR